MEPEVQQNIKKRSKNRFLLVSLISVSVIMLAAAVQFTYMTLNNENIYKGVHVGGIDASGMSKAELTNRLKSDYQNKLSGQYITLKTEHITKKTGFTELNASYNIEDAAGKAYAFGRTGSIFDRIYDIITAGTNGFSFNLPVTYDSEKLKTFINVFCDENQKNVKEADILIQDEKVTIRSGAHGESVDRNKVSSDAETLIKSGQGGEIDVAVTVTSPSKLNIDDLYQQINREPVDAGFKTENGDTTVVPHVTGRKIDKETLTAASAEIENTENTEKVLPIQLIKPKITTEDAYSKLFKDELAYMSTHFSTSTTNDANRGENIKLAVSKINGKVLAPGEVFSFNDTVGPRTAEDGYQTAHTYTAGKVVDGIGGGICQVSSTLYNAVLKADLNVIERRNHMFTVGYVPFGQDATVSFGTQDFKFSNSTHWPIKIVAGVTKNNYVFFSFVGTNETLDKKVIISNKTISKTPFTTTYIDDPTLDEGKQTIKQEGKEGFVIDTFKTVKIDGKVVSQTKLHTSKYIPLVQEVLKGTKKVSTGVKSAETTQTPTVPTTPATPTTPTTPAAPSEPTVQPAQTTPSTGVDDADNPPATE